MGKLVKSWTNIPMLLRMFVGLVVGIILAIVAKDVSWISVFGKMFVGLLKAIAPILVFFLVSASIMKI